MAASEGPEKLRDLVDARAFRPDLSFCMGSIEATIFMDLSAESASGAVDKVKFLAKLDKHASKLGGGTSKSKATAEFSTDAIFSGCFILSNANKHLRIVQRTQSKLRSTL